MEEINEDEKFFLDIHEKTKDFKVNQDLKNIPAIFKKINTKKIPLPKDFEVSNIPVEEAIVRRVSRRNFSGYIDAREAAKILYCANGFKSLEDTGKFGIVQLTTAPSAGARHPIEIYVILQRVNGISDGVYHYDNESHMLEVIHEQKFSQLELKKIFVHSKELASANMILIMTAIHRRTSWKYGHRSYRFVHLDAGHIGQNVYLACEAMGLGACAVGGWHDAFIERLLRIDGMRELIVYIMTVGKIAEGDFQRFQRQ